MNIVNNFDLNISHYHGNTKEMISHIVLLCESFDSMLIVKVRIEQTNSIFFNSRRTAHRQRVNSAWIHHIVNNNILYTSINSYCDILRLMSISSFHLVWLGVGYVQWRN